MLEAPRTRARGDNVQEDEAEQDRRVAAVRGGIEVLRRVEHPVGDPHLAGGDERGGAGEQAEDDQGAGHDLDDTADAEQAGERLEARRGDGKSHDLGEAVRDEEHAGDDAQRRQQIGLVAREVGRLRHVVSFRGFGKGRAVGREGRRVVHR